MDLSDINDNAWLVAEVRPAFECLQSIAATVNQAVRTAIETKSAINTGPPILRGRRNLHR